MAGPYARARHTGAQPQVDRQRAARRRGGPATSQPRPAETAPGRGETQGRCGRRRRRARPLPKVRYYKRNGTE